MARLRNAKPMARPRFSVAARRARNCKRGSGILAEHTSPPLLESIRMLNKISQNLHAELLLRTIAREKSGWVQPTLA